MVGLVEADREPELGCLALAILFDLIQRRGAVNVRLTHAQQIEIGAVEDHHSFHGRPFEDSSFPLRHARPCAGHPRLSCQPSETWMAGHRRAEATPFFERLCPAMTCLRSVFGLSGPSM